MLIGLRVCPVLHRHRALDGRARRATLPASVNERRTDELEDIRRELAELRERNIRVEREKAWETSWARRLLVAAMTWLGAWLWLRELGAEHAALQALVPSGAYAVSTLTLPVLRRWWMRIRFGSK